MKKFMLIFIFLFPLMYFNNDIKTNAEGVFYAKINKEEVFMYTSPNDADANKLFVLPSTYFVKLIEQANNDFYYCSYKDLKGYVKKDDVVAMSGTPYQPFVEGMFRTFSLEGLGIYSSPQLQSNCLATIPYLTDDLIYYGTIIGQEAIPDKSDKWIYCKYNSDTSICGYVYSVFCDKIPTNLQNNETFDVISDPFTIFSKPKPLSSVAMGFIVLGVTIPCVLVIILLLKPTLLKEKLNTLKPKFRAKKNRDYFEFDDSDLT